MINVTIGESKTQEVKTFPKLMKSDDLVVLFESKSVGMVVFGTAWPIGYYSRAWDDKKFTDFNELITIQNA